MTRRTAAAAAAIVASGCSGNAPQDQPVDQNAAPAVTDAGGAAPAPGPGWDLQSAGEGAALALLAADGATMVRLFCPARKRRLLVNVPAFRAVGSEERMSLGSGGEAVALVADSRGDAQLGGVTATIPTPDNLAALIGGPVSVNYGAQNSGPHPGPPARLVRAFAAACGETPPAEPRPAAPAGAPATPPHACRMQDGKAIGPIRLRAVGTEPFWGARIDGRCVTYSHPDDQAGTRVWTRFTGSREAGTWTGFHANQRFVLRTRPEPGCSDGMSDRRYPIAVSLTLAGEQRTGCAE